MRHEEYRYRDMDLLRFVRQGNITPTSVEARNDIMLEAGYLNIFLPEFVVDHVNGG